LGGLFHKKQDDAPATAAATERSARESPAGAAPATTPVPLPPGDVALITIASQLISASTDGASADAFAVPPDFKRQETKAQ
ncbi:MAG: hypothetical protein JO042_03105, partial [Sinobacteraceae bacterium]|nr:hypothetical protein [Nevskiaceae bacterium]